MTETWTLISISYYGRNLDFDQHQLLLLLWPEVEHWFL
jgi:hypothetical protein